MKKKKFLEYTAFCFTMLFLIGNTVSTGLAAEFNLLNQWGERIYGPRELNKEGLLGPVGMSIDPSGIMYLGDQNNHRIQKYNTANGDWLGLLTECEDWIGADQRHCTDPGEIKGPVDVAVDPTGDYVYIVSPHWSVVSKFDTTIPYTPGQSPPDNFVLSWGFDPVQNDVETADFMREPTGIAVDENGDVYVTDIWGSAILKFDPNGNLLDMITHPYLSGDGFRPTGIALGHKGIYVTDFLNSTVHRFERNGALKDSWGGFDGTAAGEFIYPAALEIVVLGNDNDDFIIVADSFNNRIQTLNESWTTYSGDGEGPFDRPFGIATDANGYVYVADTFHHRVLQYDFTP
jgi:DNA-binding beta-propeller fold protein YncE